MAREKPSGGFVRDTQIKMPRAAAVRPWRVLAVLSRCSLVHGYSSPPGSNTAAAFVSWYGTPRILRFFFFLFFHLDVSTRFACPVIQVNLMVHHYWFPLGLCCQGFNPDSWNWNSFDHGDPKTKATMRPAIWSRNGIKIFRMWSRDFKVRFLISAIL